LPNISKRLSIADEDTGASPAAGAHHDCHGSGEPESARAGDDQDSNSIYECMSESRLRTDEEPHSKGNNGGNDYSRDKVRGDLIRQPLDRRS
jgi:hypothetical protein